MAKGSGTSKTTSLPHTSVIEKLKQSQNWNIRVGMKRYDEEKNNPAWDYSDMNNLSETDKTYLVAYLSNSYSVINEALRKDSMNDETKAMVRGIDKAMGKLDTFEGTVYRGIRFEYGPYTKKQNAQRYADTLAYYKNNVGKDIVEKSYISTGKVKTKIDKKFTTSYAPSLKFTIESKTGRDVSHYNNEEREVVFKRNTKFRVVSVKGNNIHLKEV